MNLSNDGKIWTLSNILSLSRILFLIPVALFLQTGTPGGKVYAFLSVCIAAMTDFLDGLIARKMNQVSDMGKFLDPLADKIALGGVVILLVMYGMLPLWFVLLEARDPYFTRKVFGRTGILLQSNWIGKWTAAVLALVSGIAMLDLQQLMEIKNILLYGSVILMLWSLTSYTQRFLTIIRSK